MQIGIKYCGGCNPCYDRPALLGRLKAAFPGITFTTADAAGNDLNLVLCGCGRLCAFEAAPAGRLGKLAATRAADYDTLVKHIEIASQQEKENG